MPPRSQLSPDRSMLICGVRAFSVGWFTSARSPVWRWHSHARNGSDLRRLLTTSPMSALITESVTPIIEDRALEVMGLLADRGQHRAASIPDLLVAATAESENLIVLHRDKDFELIAEITGQPLERID